MELINKSALVAEIESCINRCNIKKQSCLVNTQVEAICDNKICAYKELLSFLDTLEVKEVDFEKEYEKYYEQERYIQTFKLAKHFFELGLKAQKEEYKHLWKPADGDELPPFDKEVIALEADCFCGCKVVFTHRPTLEGYDGKSIAKGVVEHYTPKTYGEGGWNIPDIVYWLDVEFPKEIEP